MFLTGRSGLWLLIFALAWLPLSVVAKTRPEGPAQEIERLENQYSQSFVTGDARVAQALLAEDFIGFGPNGQPWDKASILADVRSLPHQASAKITSISVRIHGDTAVALGTEDDVNSPASTVSHRRWLDTWRRAGQGWRLVASAESQPSQ